MQIGEKIKKTRQSKNLAQKEVALALGMDQSQYSRIENGKTDPYFSTIDKIAQALNVQLAELLMEEIVFKSVDSYDRSLVEKIELIEQLEENERKSIFYIVDGLVSKKRLKDTLTKALSE